MIPRRAVLVGAAAVAAMPRALAQTTPASRIAFRGSHEEGGLVVGEAADADGVTVDGKGVNVTGGMFVFGIAYDRAAPIVVEAHYGRDVIERTELVPVVRQYQIQRVNGLPQKMVTPSPEDLARIERENALIVEARTRDTDGVGFAEPFDWPFAGIVTSVYGSQRIENGTPMAPHLGIDIAAPEGTPIHAAADGIVSISDDYFVDGGFTLIDHGHGVSTCYLHQSKRMVAAGDKVKRGDVIGQVGMTGRATGPHTHWGLAWFQVKLDPSRSTATPEPPRV